MDFSPSSPPFNVVPMFELPIENNKLTPTISQQFCRRL